MAVTTFYEDKRGEHRWNVKGDNGEIIGASSEGFSSERECRKNLERLATAIQIYANATDDE